MKDQEFLISLAESCFRNDKRFEQWNEFFKNGDISLMKGVASDKMLKKLQKLAKENKLNIYFQNVLVLA